MEKQHSSACGRQVAVRIEQAHGSRYDAARAVHQHCGVSLLRAHRIAHGLTLTEVTDRLKAILRERGVPGEGLAHQMVSRWETGVDLPSPRYFDAVCQLYQSRPDRLGFGHDYSAAEEPPAPEPPAPEPPGTGLSSILFSSPEVGGALADVWSGSARLDGHVALGAVQYFEQRAEESGYDLYTSTPQDFVPERMIDIAGIQRLLLQRQPDSLQRRLHRALAKNAGFIGVRLTDVAGVQDTFNWFGVAKQAARRAEDAGVEAWIAGHLCDAHSCYGHSLRQGLETARIAQLASGPRPNSAALFGYLSEAGVQARLGHRRETLDAVRQAERIFDVLPDDMIAADGIRIPEYFLRWHQSNALSIIGEGRLAEPLRRRALELPLSQGDLVGRSLLALDEAFLAFRTGEVDRACHLIRHAWESVPPEFHVGQIPSRTRVVLASLPTVQSATPAVRDLGDQLRSMNRAYLQPT